MKVKKRPITVYAVAGKRDGGSFIVGGDDGRTYFPTREEAEAVLARYQEARLHPNLRVDLRVEPRAVLRFFYGDRQISFTVVGTPEDPGVMSVRYVDDGSRVEDAAYESLINDHYTEISGIALEQEFARGWDEAKAERERED